MLWTFKSATSAICIRSFRGILPEDLQAMRDALAMLRSFDLREINYPLPGAATDGKRLRRAVPTGAVSERDGRTCCLRGRITCRAGTSATRALADHRRPMIYRIVHRSTYKYRSPVSVGNHVACLKPRTLPHHQLMRSELHIQPAPATRTERVDYFGNCLCFFTVQEPHKELMVEARSEVADRREHDAVAAICAYLGRGSQIRCAGDLSPEGLEAYQFAFESPRIRMRPEFAAYARAVVYAWAAHDRGAAGSDCAHSQGFPLRLQSRPMCGRLRKRYSRSAMACARILRTCRLPACVP